MHGCAVDTFVSSAEILRKHRRAVDFAYLLVHFQRLHFLRHDLCSDIGT